MDERNFKTLNNTTENQAKDQVSTQQGNNIAEARFTSVNNTYEEIHKSYKEDE